jgi:molybdenum cofactor synthesis domain-containing protein
MRICKMGIFSRILPKQVRLVSRLAFSFLQWMVLEARQLVDQGIVDDMSTQQALNAFGYEEAAEHVYGMTYSDWKKRHQQKVTEEQMGAFNASKDLHAKHRKDLLETRNYPPPVPVMTEATTGSNNLLSNVCCENVAQPPITRKESQKECRTVDAFQPPPLPPNLPVPLRVGVLTISDRANKNEYSTGDLSGPAVIQAVTNVFLQYGGKELALDTSCIAVVPDEAGEIQMQLRSWTEGDDALHVILTTGGTGMSPRDVTPEATRSVLDQECSGLMAFVTTECSRLQPLASLSRGAAGFRGTTMIANLPGNPMGVAEVVPVLLPILLHAVADLQAKQ